MSQIALEMTGEDNSAARMLAGMVKLERKVESGLKDIRREAKSTKQGFNGAFPTAGVSKFVGLLTGAGGVLGALKLVTNEIRQIIDLQTRASGKQISVGGARKDVVRNLFGASAATIGGTLKAGSNISKSTNVPEQFIQSALASALSASGQNVPASIAAVTQAANFLADKPDQISLFAGSLLDLSRATGTTDARVNQGFLGLIGGLSRVVDPIKQAQTIPRSVIGQQAFGATPQEAGALFAALSTAGGDFLGASSATGTISLAQQLRDFSRGEGAFAKLPAGSRPTAGTTGDVLGQLQADPALAKRFLDKASFEKVVAGPIEQLITSAGSEVSKLFSSNVKAFVDNKGLALLADQSIKNFGLDPLERVSSISRILQGGSEQALLSDLASGEAGTVREGLISLLRNTGKGSLAESFVKTKFELFTNLGREDPTGYAIDVLRGEAGRLSHPFTETETNVGGLRRTPRDPTQDERRNADILLDIANKLEQQNSLLRTLGGGTAKMGPFQDQGGPGQQN